MSKVKERKLAASVVLFGAFALLMMTTCVAPQASAAGFDSLEAHYNGTNIVVTGSIQGTQGPLDLLISSPEGTLISNPPCFPNIDGTFSYSWAKALPDGIGYSVRVTAYYTVANGGGNEQKTVYFNVPAVTSVTLNLSTLSLNVGKSSSLIPFIAPSNAAVKSVTWSSSNPSVATVDSDGVVKGVATGTAKITATTTDGGYRADCAVTVTNAPLSSAPVTGVSINQTTLSLTMGGTDSLAAAVTSSDATNKSVVWSSSDNSVATVGSNGKVTAVNAGTATIVVTTSDGGHTASCTVTVEGLSDGSEQPASESDDDTIIIAVAMIFVLAIAIGCPYYFLVVKRGAKSR